MIDHLFFSGTNFAHERYIQALTLTRFALCVSLQKDTNYLWLSWNPFLINYDFFVCIRTTGQVTIARCTVVETHDRIGHLTTTYRMRHKLSLWKPHRVLRGVFFLVNARQSPTNIFRNLQRVSVSTRSQWFVKIDRSSALNRVPLLLTNHGQRETNWLSFPPKLELLEVMFACLNLSILHLLFHQLPQNDASE